jgi:glutamate synthase (ferredoxin)
MSGGLLMGESVGKCNLRSARLEQIKKDPGRGGCGILALAELTSGPSNELVQLALEGLVRMEHRGGVLEDTGDGAGILIAPERKYFERFIRPGKCLPSKKEPLVVGTVFFPHGERNFRELCREIDMVLRSEGMAPMGWRRVPVDESVLGKRARDDAPLIYQLFVAKGNRRESQFYEALHDAKVKFEGQFSGLFNIVSLAPHTTVYKALGTSEQLADFYLDLKDPDLRTNMIVGHRRFSTNTFSNWNLIQPFRHIAHNGEINTITANCKAIRDAESAINLGDTLMNHGSDSAQLDRVVEMMVTNGIGGIHEALRRMIPPAWEEGAVNDRTHQFFSANRRAMGTIGAWEGPIAIVGTDGQVLTAVLDRMGLRPLRYVKSTSGRLAISSEAGAIPIRAEDIACDGQLEPGGMLIANTSTGELILPEESTDWVVDNSNLDFKNLSTVDLIPLKDVEPRDPLEVKALNIFGWTRERIGYLKEMVEGVKEPVYGMGNDRPLAIYSENHSRLYSFLHQIVAVVTNPPIDPLREGDAIDTTVYLGRSPRISKQSDYRSYPQYELDHPILTNERLESLFSDDAPKELRAHRLDATFKDRGKSRDIVRRIHDLTEEALEVIRSKKASILIVSDRTAIGGAGLPLPMLLVISAIHQALAAKGLRRDASIVAETGEVHEGHDIAILLAYGATAVNPYAMFSLARGFDGFSREKAMGNVVEAVLGTLKRVMSKMGITTIAGYRGSALFEAIGISSDIVEYYIPDTYSRLGGVTMDDIYNDIVSRNEESGETMASNRNISVYRKEVVDALQCVARNGNAAGDYDHFVQLLNDTPPVYLRDMLEFKNSGSRLSIEDVVDASEILRTTVRGAAMSHGALNATAHRAIAAAFNHFGSFSNSGEGGEDPRRNIDGEWCDDRSKARQIASGRFGVDATYIVNADEVEIKIGQGAKPGEGGHLPGYKVTAEIARIRKTKQGVDLISPPPHHDIYSIEDLSQLIRNIREMHPSAVISVKVPSVTRLGTIAVGITKAGADVIVISGFSGGTGAASLGSITHAGLPLERGVSEVQQYLVTNGIRSQVRIRADGGMKSGVDIAKILAMGADEVTIGTPLLVAECCVFCRGCSRGSCPVGIATQDEDALNKRFMRRRMSKDDLAATTYDERYGEARDGVIRYLECVGEHLRRILANLGLHDPSELVGRVDLLEQVMEDGEGCYGLDLSEMLLDYRADTRATPGRLPAAQGTISEANEKILNTVKTCLEQEGGDVGVRISIQNYDHALGSTLAGEIAKRGIKDSGKRIEITASGCSGHGFAFGATDGMTMRLTGYANDAVAEIMSGDALVTVIPSADKNGRISFHLIGNAAAYGATGGRLFVAGRAGQRFGVRNSGAILVCEGVGKYAFEYMTGGCAVVIGSCGPCMGSGMTGGRLFIYDPDGQSTACVHPDLVIEPDISEELEGILKDILVDYFDETGSPCARNLLDGWSDVRSNFISVRPR